VLAWQRGSSLFPVFLGQVARYFPAAIARLITLHGHSKAFVRAGAARALVQTKRRGRAAIPALLGALHDRDQEVVEMEIYALKELKARRAIPAIARLLVRQRKQIRTAAVDTLRFVCGWQDDFAKRVEEALAQDKVRLRLLSRFRVARVNSHSLSGVMEGVLPNGGDRAA
jgi:HEAT repeat protein